MFTCVNKKCLYFLCVCFSFLLSEPFCASDPQMFLKVFFAFFGNDPDVKMMGVNGLYDVSSYINHDTIVKRYVRDIADRCFVETYESDNYLTTMGKQIVSLADHVDVFIGQCDVQYSHDGAIVVYSFKKNSVIDGQDWIFVFKIMLQFFQNNKYYGKKQRNGDCVGQEFLSTCQAYEYIFNSCCNPVEIKGIIEYKRDVGVAHGKNK